MHVPTVSNVFAHHQCNTQYELGTQENMYFDTLELEVRCIIPSLDLCLVFEKRTNLTKSKSKCHMMGTETSIVEPVTPKTQDEHVRTNAYTIPRAYKKNVSGK